MITHRLALHEGTTAAVAAGSWSAQVVPLHGMYCVCEVQPSFACCSKPAMPSLQRQWSGMDCSGWSMYHHCVCWSVEVEVYTHSSTMHQCVSMLHCRVKAVQALTRVLLVLGRCASALAPSCWWTRYVPWEACLSLLTPGAWTAYTAAHRSVCQALQVGVALVCCTAREPLVRRYSSSAKVVR